MNEETNLDVTETLPTMDPKTRSRIKTGTAILLGAAVLGLVIDDQIKKFKNRKTVTVTVEDNSSN